MDGLLADWPMVHQLACVPVCVFVVIVAVAASMTTSVLREGLIARRWRSVRSV